MFDIGWSELLVLGIVALIVIGPKDLPVVLRTIGRYAGMIRKQANEFRAQFEEAIRETEYETIKKEMDALGQDVATSVREASAGLEKEFDEARRAIDQPQAPADAGAESPTASETPAATEPAAAETAPEQRGAALAESGATGGKAG